MLVKEAEKAIKEIILLKEYPELKKILTINEIIKDCNSVLQSAYKEGVQSQDWRAYNTMKNIKECYIQDIEKIVKGVKAWKEVN